jgi:hypothetical protein
MNTILKKNTSKRTTWALWRTALLGALLLIGYLGGALLGNIILRADFSLPLALGLFVWAGAWLRVRELRRLIPMCWVAGSNTER